MGKRIQKLIQAGLAGCMAVTMIHFELVPTNKASVHAAGTAGTVAHYVDKRAVAPLWSAAPAIDGALDEAQWGEAAVLDHFRTAYFEYEPESSIKYKVAYDSQYVYIAGVMDEEEAETLADIEVVISPQLGGSDHYVARLTVDPNDTSITTTAWNLQRDSYSANPGLRLLDGVQYQLGTSGGTTTVEAAIPLTAIAPAGVTTGDEWRLNVIHVHRSLTRPLTSWVPIRHSDHWDRYGDGGRLNGMVVDQGRLGGLFFGALPAALTPSGGSAAAVESWTPQQTELVYTGFGEKELSFAWPHAALTGSGDIRLQWKEPDVGWQELTPTALSASGGRQILSFTHPGPLKDGMYQLRLTVLPAGAAEALSATLMIDREHMVAAGLELAPSMTSGVQPVTVPPAPPSAKVQELLELIPPQPGFIYVGLPEMPELFPQSLYTLSQDGKSMTAARTGTVYPNPAYPEDQEYVTANAKGETVRIPYYEDSSGKRYFITAHLWYLQKQRVLAQTRTVSQSDPLGAARLLYGIAQAYEGYNPTIDQPWNYESQNKLSGPPYSYWGGMWYRWFGFDLDNLGPLFQAYTNVRKTNAFEVLSAEAGEDVEALLRDKLFGASIDNVLSHPVWLSNLAYGYWNGLVGAAKALNEPDYVHMVVAQMEEMMGRLFLSDGFWQEVTLSYHKELINGIQQVIDKLNGWTDPVGYVSPRSGKRLVNLDLEQDYPVIGRAMRHERQLLYPNGNFYPLQDTWAYEKASSPDPLVSKLWPAAGIGRLTGGTGADQTQVYLNYQAKYPTHVHRDPLHLGLFAERQELLPDLGYTFSTFYRYFTLSTMSHNTVVVNSQNAVTSGAALHGGNVEAFVPQEGGFKAMRASYESAYPATDEYRREPWFVPFAGGNGQQGYVLDLFRVSGGSRHEYTLQGDANRDAYFETEMTLDDYGPYLLPPGTNVVQPVDNTDSGSAEGHYPGYIYVRDVQQAQLAGDRYQLTLMTQNNGAAASRMRITGLLEAGASNELYLGRSPSLRAARLEGRSKDNNDEAVRYSMPKLVLRRDGTNVKSTFVTLLEPYAASGAPKVEAIDRLQPQQAPIGAVAVKVAYGDTTDLLLSNPDYAKHGQPLLVDDIALYGELGLVRIVNGEVSEMKLSGGTLLQKGSRKLTGAGSVNGTVAGTLSMARGDAYDGILTGTPVPQSAAGRYALVTHADGSRQGFPIAEVRQHNGQTLIVFDDEDPGFAILPDGSAEQTYFPKRTWTAAPTFAIANVERAVWPPAGAPEPERSGSVHGTVLDTDGLPVQGASVNVTGNQALTAETDASGGYSLTGIPEGWQRFTATDARHQPVVTDAVYVTAGQTQTVPISFHRRLPPVLSGTPAFGVQLGEPVTVVSSVYAAAYLVPAATPASPAGLEAAVRTENGVVYGVKTTAQQDVPATLVTSGMKEGRYTLYAVDRWGQVSPGKPVHVLEAIAGRFDDDHARLSYTGTWSAIENAQLYGGKSRQTGTAGAAVTIQFYGSRAKVLSLVGGSRGQAEVYVDGVFRQIIDTYSTSVKYQHVIFDTGVLESGVHEIRIAVTGKRQPSSTGTFINIDAVEVTSDYKLSDVTAGPVAAGSPVKGTSPQQAQLYLVPDRTEETAAAVQAAGQVSGRTVTVQAGVYGAIDTTGLPSGWYRLYAINGAGQLSQGSAPLAVVDTVAPLGLLDDSSPLIRYAGSWMTITHASQHGGTSRQAADPGTYADIAFYGTGAQLWSLVGTARGLADVYLDGVLQTTIDQYSPSAVRYKYTTYDSGSLQPGLHVVRIAPKGTKTSGATGTWVNIDAVQINTIPVPVTRAYVSGLVGNGWYAGKATVTMQVYSDVSMVRQTEYSLDGGGSWLRYEKPITITTSGEHTLKYRSVSTAGHSELAKSLTVRVDALAPTIELRANNSLLTDTASFSDAQTVTLNVYASDAHSGVASRVLIVNGSVYAEGMPLDFAGRPGDHLIRVSATDMAGNRVELSYTLRIYASVEGMLQLLDRYAATGDVSGPLVPQLRNSLEQVRHQFDKGHLKQAEKHMGDFLKRMNNLSQQDHISSLAQQVFTGDANDLIARWS
ncbi:FIMAH domain-containing protein [Paenibacillus mesophilus]|uniref:FIMAH domain-containing protein n=1 Tax=Paenibacillus mesophilus TaxID=2582849 RepID=UPI00130513EA|nr:carboxypeptidase regulatory-like domain-containing protein [Paenibacillus mesophilus]